MIVKFLFILIYGLTRLLQLTYRFRYDNNAAIQSLGSRNFILAIWHQSLFAGLLAQRGKKHVVIVSKSTDAQPVAFVAHQMGHVVTRGSSRKGAVDKGGKIAKEEMILELKKGIPGAVTVDGPKGPAFEVKPGIIDMAVKADVLIVPYVLAFSSYWEFKSWDRFRLPKPFSKILISYGSPLDVSDSSVDQRLIVETALKNQAVIAENAMSKWNQYPRDNWWQSSGLRNLHSKIRFPPVIVNVNLENEKHQELKEDDDDVDDVYKGNETHKTEYKPE